MPIWGALAGRKVFNLVQGKFNDISTELESWYGSDAGQYLLAQTRASLSSILDTSFGYHLLQIGPAREQSLFEDSPINHRIYASSRDGGTVGLISEPESLPLESDSVDTLIAHHCLEFAEEPHQALREMQRVLTPQGKLIIIGLNPYSLLGGAVWIRRKMGSRLWSSHQPVSQHRLNDWLRLLGCPVESQQMLYSIPPVGSGQLQNGLKRADRWCNASKLPVGGVYLVHAIKQVAGIHRPAKVRSRRERLIGLTVPKPSTVPSPTPARPITRNRKIIH